MTRDTSWLSSFISVSWTSVGLPSLHTLGGNITSMLLALDVKDWALLSTFMVLLAILGGLMLRLRRPCLITTKDASTQTSASDSDDSSEEQDQSPFPPHHQDDQQTLLSWPKTSFISSLAHGHAEHPTLRERILRAAPGVPRVQRSRLPTPTRPYPSSSFYLTGGNIPASPASPQPGGLRLGPARWAEARDGERGASAELVWIGEAPYPLSPMRRRNAVSISRDEKRIKI